MKKNIFLLIIFCLPFFSFAQSHADVDGFRGIKWDTPMSDFSFDLVKSKNRIPGYKAFDKKSGENFNFEGITAHTITYAFEDEVFYAINIGIKKKDLKTIVAKFTTKYGEPKVKDSPIVVNYEWYLDKTMISVTYLPMVQGEKTVSIGMGKPKDMHKKGKKSKKFKISF
jgi:hypothetical protein